MWTWLFFLPLSRWTSLANTPHPLTTHSQQNIWWERPSTRDHLSLQTTVSNGMRTWLVFLSLCRWTSLAQHSSSKRPGRQSETTSTRDHLSLQTTVSNGMRTWSLFLPLCRWTSLAHHTPPPLTIFRVCTGVLLQTSKTFPKLEDQFRRPSQGSVTHRQFVQEWFKTKFCLYRPSSIVWPPSCCLFQILLQIICWPLS